MTKEQLDKLIEEELAWAKRTKRTLGYSERDNFPIRLTLLHGELKARVPADWSNQEEKARYMRKVAYLAKAMDVDAVLLVTDLRMVSSEDFVEHFKLPQPKDIGADEFKRQYQEVMERYDYQMVNLPRHLWTESIGVIAKSREHGVRSRMTPYTRGSGKSVLFLEPKNPGPQDKFSMPMLGDWWEIADNDPNVHHLQALAVEMLDKMNKVRNGR